MNVDTRLGVFTALVFVIPLSPQLDWPEYTHELSVYDIHGAASTHRASEDGGRREEYIFL